MSLDFESSEGKISEELSQEKCLCSNYKLHIDRKKLAGAQERVCKLENCSGQVLAARQYELV